MKTGRIHRHARLHAAHVYSRGLLWSSAAALFFATFALAAPPLSAEGEAARNYYAERFRDPLKFSAPKDRDFARSDAFQKGRAEYLAAEPDVAALAQLADILQREEPLGVEAADTYWTERRDALERLAEDARFKHLAASLPVLEIARTLSRKTYDPASRYSSGYFSILTPEERTLGNKYSVDAVRNAWDLLHRQGFRMEKTRAWEVLAAAVALQDDAREARAMQTLEGLKLGPWVRAARWEFLGLRQDFGVERPLRLHELSATARVLHGLLLDPVQRVGRTSPVAVSAEELSTLLLYPHEVRRAWGQLEFFDPQLATRLQRARPSVETAAKIFFPQVQRLARQYDVALDPFAGPYRAVQSQLHPQARRYSAAEIEAMVMARTEVEKRRLAANANDTRIQRYAQQVRNELEEGAAVASTRSTPLTAEKYDALLEQLDKALEAAFRERAIRMIHLAESAGITVYRGTENGKPKKAKDLKPEDLYVPVWDENMHNFRPGSDVVGFRYHDQKGQDRSLSVVMGKTHGLTERDAVDALFLQLEQSLEPLLLARGQVAKMRQDISKGNLADRVAADRAVLEKMAGNFAAAAAPNVFVENPVAREFGPQAVAIYWEGYLQPPGDGRYWEDRAAKSKYRPELADALDGKFRTLRSRLLRPLQIVGVAAALGLAGWGVHELRPGTGAQFGDFQSQMVDFNRHDDSQLFTLAEGATRAPLVVEVVSMKGIDKQDLSPLDDRVGAGASGRRTVRASKPQHSADGVLPLASLRDFAVTAVTLTDRTGKRLAEGVDFDLRQTPLGRPVAVFRANYREQGPYTYETMGVPSLPKETPPVLLSDYAALEHVASVAEREGLPEIAEDLRNVLEVARKAKRPVHLAEVEAVLDRNARYTYEPAGWWQGAWRWNEPLGGLRDFRRDGKLNYQCAQANKALYDALDAYRKKSKARLLIEQLHVVAISPDGTFRTRDLHAQVAAAPGPLKATERATIADATPHAEDPAHPRPPALGPLRTPARDESGTPKDVLAAIAVAKAPSAHEAPRNRELPPPSDLAQHVGELAGWMALESQRRPNPNLRLEQPVAVVAAGPPDGSRPAEPATPAAADASPPGGDPPRTHGPLAELRVAPLPDAAEGVLSRALTLLQANPGYRRERLTVRQSDDFVGSQVYELARLLLDVRNGRATWAPRDWVPGGAIADNDSLDFKNGGTHRSVLGLLKRIDGKAARAIASVDAIPEAIAVFVRRLETRLAEVHANLPSASPQLAGMFLHYGDASYRAQLTATLRAIEAAYPAPTNCAGPLTALNPGGA